MRSHSWCAFKSKSQIVSLCSSSASLLYSQVTGCSFLGWCLSWDLFVTESLIVQSLDLFELLVVLSELRVLLQSDEELSLFGLGVSLSLHGDGLGLDLLVDTIVVSKDEKLVGNRNT